MQKDRLWLVLLVVGNAAGRVMTEVVGIFSSEKLASEACLSNKHGMGPLNLNKPAPNESTNWEGFYYPVASEPKP